MTTRFTCLHISDLHMGAPNSLDRWKGIQPRFRSDLGSLIQQHGQPAIVFFSGDLAFSGCEAEYDLVDEFLSELEGIVGPAVLVPVPGNHDLLRPKHDDPCMAALKSYLDHPELRQAAMQPGSSMNKVMSGLFENYSKWFARSVEPRWAKASSLRSRRGGAFPGDELLSFELNNSGMLIGVACLNSAYLQVDSSDYDGRLAVEPGQLADLHGWAGAHALNIMVMHHPTDWLEHRVKEAFLSDVFDPDLFALCLCGHRHESGLLITSGSAQRPRRVVVASSLCGLEKFGAPPTERTVGYNFMTFEIAGDTIKVDIHPRSQVLSSDRVYRFDRDASATTETLRIPRYIGGTAVHDERAEESSAIAPPFVGATPSAPSRAAPESAGGAPPPSAPDAEIAARSAMRAFLQRAEVRLSTMHRIAGVFLNGAGLLALLPFLFGAPLGAMLGTFAGNASEVRNSPAYLVGVFCGLVACAIVFGVPLYALYLLIKDLVNFYFTPNIYGFGKEDYFHPRFVLSGLAYPLDETAGHRSAILRAEHNESLVNFVVGRNRAQRARFESVYADTAGGIVPATRREDLKRYQIDTEGQSDVSPSSRDLRALYTAFGLAGVLDRTLAEEVAKMEASLVRHGLALRHLVLRYTKALILTVLTLLIMLGASTISEQLADKRGQLGVLLIAMLVWGGASTSGGADAGEMDIQPWRPWEDKAHGRPK
jgi:hypothetical protein